MKCCQCGTNQPDKAKFCNECGAPLSPAPPTQAMPSGPVNPASEWDRRRGGERKLVTVLFADVTGFTSLAETVDPEPLRDLINACFERLVPCVERYGGTVDKFIGDEVMAVFGAPIAHDNDPERAVRAALDMRIALAAFNAERGTTLDAHFGINSGLVLAGPVGAGSRAEYSVMGDAVNVASRLAEAAAPGEILAGPTTCRLARQFFSCEPTGQVRLRGRNEPLAVWRVIGEATTGAADPGTSSGRLIGSPLVGRDEERDRFLAALARTHAGEGGVLFVLGEAGLGKSRLAAEVRRVCPAGLLWLEGRSQSFGMDLSYLPFREILRQTAGIDDGDPDEGRLEKLARLVERLQGGENPWALPSLGVLLGLSLPEELAQRVASLDGETMGRQVVRSLLHLLRRLAEEQALVLLLEDIQWLDPSSLAFLEDLLPLAREIPLLVVLVGRPDTDSLTAALHATAQGCCGDRVEEMLLAPLHPEDMRVLVRNLVGGEDLPRDLRETVAAKAEGNPLFVEEVIRGPHRPRRPRAGRGRGLPGHRRGRRDHPPRYPERGDHRPYRPPARGTEGGPAHGSGHRPALLHELLAAVAPDPQSLATNLAHLQERELVRALDSESATRLRLQARPGAGSSLRRAAPSPSPGATRSGGGYSRAATF